MTDAELELEVSLRRDEVNEAIDSLKAANNEKAARGTLSSPTAVYLAREAYDNSIIGIFNTLQAAQAAADRAFGSKLDWSDPYSGKRTDAWAGTTVAHIDEFEVES